MNYYPKTIETECTNKLCDYIGSITLYKTYFIKEKIICPKYGFRTLTNKGLQIKDF